MQRSYINFFFMQWNLIHKIVIHIWKQNFRIYLDTLNINYVLRNSLVLIFFLPLLIFLSWSHSLFLSHPHMKYICQSCVKGNYIRQYLSYGCTVIGSIWWSVLTKQLLISERKERKKKIKDRASNIIKKLLPWCFFLNVDRYRQKNIQFKLKATAEAVFLKKKIK